MFAVVHRQGQLLRSPCLAAFRNLLGAMLHEPAPPGPGICQVQALCVLQIIKAHRHSMTQVILLHISKRTAALHLAATPSSQNSYYSKPPHIVSQLQSLQVDNVPYKNNCLLSLSNSVRF